MHILDRLPPYIAIVLALLLLALWTLQLLPIYQQQNNTVPVTQTAKPTMPETSAEPARQYEVANFKLFGDASKPPPMPEPVEENLPETQLKLTLTGVLAGQVDSQTGALIEGPDRETLYYKVGDTLPGNAMLHKVYADRIVVRRAGRLENLYFPEEPAGGLQAFQDYRDVPSATPSPTPTTQPAALPSGGISDARKRSIKERLSNLRKRIINNRN